MDICRLSAMQARY